MLDTTVHELKCKDEVDQTESTRKWDKKATQQLEKPNGDCNKTAGLEFVLNVAVGARVMLHRNIVCVFFCLFWLDFFVSRTTANIFLQHRQCHSIISNLHSAVELSCCSN